MSDEQTATDLALAAERAASSSEVSALQGTVSQQSATIQQQTATIQQQSSTIATLTSEVQQLNPAYLPGYGLPTFEDLFDGTSITKWNVRHTEVNYGTTQETYTNSPIVANGYCTLPADWIPTSKAMLIEQHAFQGEHQDSERNFVRGMKAVSRTHASAYMDHRALHPGDIHYSQRWGVWQFRAKVPTGPNTLGAQPAFWLRGDNDLFELDLSEWWGYGAAAKVTSGNTQPIGTSTTSLHTKTTGGGVDYAQTMHPLPNAYADFHDYKFELKPSYFRVTIDGIENALWVPGSAKTRPSDAPDGPAKNVVSHPELWTAPTSPLHMRVNLHIGASSTYWGLADPAHKELTQPLNYTLDYVRAYALAA